MKYHQRIICSVMALLVSMAFAAPARAATPEQIDAAIKKAVAYLYGRQNAQGNWEESQVNPGGSSGETKGQWGGRTALVVYALLAAGEKPLDPRIVKATEWLRTAPISGQYSVGVRANVWLNLPLTEPNKQSMVKEARLLLSGISKSGANKGFHSYNPGPGGIDLSCAQYGVLGSWAAAQRIEEIPPAFWTLVENSWREQQDSAGGWAYNGKASSRESSIQLTAAGVATLFITQEFLHSNEGIEGNKGNIVDPWINKGLASVSKRFPDSLKKLDSYAMYAVERVGVASGYKYFGDADWFKEGADVFIRSQKGEGNWTGGHASSEASTSFGILFLARGGAPVMMNKLQYNVTPPKAKEGKEANWNQRPRDVAYATRWVEEKTERTLNWQIITLDKTGVDDLHDSSILYITGNQTLSFSDKEKAVLKQYIEEGGMIIGNADVGKNEFVKSFRELAGELFPTEEFQQLQDKMDHPLMVSQQFIGSNWKRKPRIEGLGNRARLFMVLIPNDDFSRSLQMRDTNKEEIFEFFANAYLYSTDKTQGKYKGETHVVRADPKINAATSIKVARLKYNGRWDPEPGGWRQLAAVMNNRDKVKLETKTVELGKDSLAEYKIAHLTGTGQFKLSEQERTALKTFISSGGLLVIDAAGGFGEFDAAVQSELSSILPNEVSQITQPFKSDHVLYTAEAAEKVEPKYRVYAQIKLGADATRFRIRGITVDNKLAVIYSPDDLSVGLVGNAIDGIIGYAPDTATTLMRRILLLKTNGKI